jgi:hypothetical protein
LPTRKTTKVGVYFNEVSEIISVAASAGPVAGLVGTEGGVVSEVINLESSGVGRGLWASVAPFNCVVTSVPTSLGEASVIG